MKRSILVNFRQYTNFGEEFYQPILDFFMKNMAQYQDEFDELILLPSQWDIPSVRDDWNLPKTRIIQTDPSLRYFDVYKQMVKELDTDEVLFLDNDSIVLEKGVIDGIFKKLEEGYRAVSIFDIIGPDRFNELGGQSKVCPYLLAMPRALLSRYTDCEWGPNMPEHETLGGLTRSLINSGAGYKFYEFPEDKSNILFDGTKDGEQSKRTGFYHIRAGTTISYLLATKTYGDMETYTKYITEQPRMEILRHLAWFYYMLSSTGSKIDITDFLKDLNIDLSSWYAYFNAFKKYHNLV